MSLSVFLLSSTLLTAQIPLNQDTSDYPYWIEMMHEDGIKLSAVSSAFNVYWNGREVTKGSGYKPFKRWEYRMQKRVDEYGYLPPKSFIAEALAEAKFTRSISGNWKPLGPNFNQTTLPGDIYGVGRINTVAFHPTIPTTIYAGAPAGGLWVSEDNGNTWEVLTDYLPTLGVSAVIVDPDNPSTIYIGTGDRDGNDTEGLGVFKSTDGGLSWQQSNTGMGDVIVNEMRFDPDSSNVIFAATDDGIWKSYDSGDNWTKKNTIPTNYEDIEVLPNDSETMMACGGGRIYRSADGGETWNMVSGQPMANRLFLAVTPADPNRVYALLCNQRSFHSFWESTNKGQSFAMKSDSPNIMGYDQDGGDTGGQAWYDAGLGADPNDADVVYVLGINVWKSTDAGVNWAYNSPGMHVDQHYIAFSPHTDEIYVGNDGGIYRSDIGNNGWTDISGTMVVGQMYKLGQSATTADLVLTGFQDNGTARFDGSGWVRISGADGMECQVDATDPNYMYSTYQYGTIRRSTNGGASTSTIGGTGNNGINEDGAWVTPFTIAEHNDSVMYAGYENIWRTTRLKESDNDSVLWERISTGGLGASDEFDVIEHSPANPDILYVGNGSRFSRSDNCNDAAGSVNWTTITTGMVGGNINDIEAHPTDENVVYIVKGNGVMKSSNKGQNWTDITGNLPAITKTCLVYDTTTNEGLYVGTLAGVYYKDSSMTSWVYFGNGLPYAIEVSELDIYYGAQGDSPRLRASTYGRGLWESDLYGNTTINFPAVALIQAVDENPKREVYEPFDISVSFYKNLENVEVTQFDQTDIQVTNGTISSFSGGPTYYTVTIDPVSPGVISIEVPDDAALDSDSVLSEASEVFEVVYVDAIQELGIEGPGGVGSLSELSLWLMPEFGLENAFGATPSSTGEDIAAWEDLSMNAVPVGQNNSNLRPTYLEGVDGINGRPALSFRPDTSSTLGQYLSANDVRLGQNFAGFTTVQTISNNFYQHGWMGSARGANGFVIHPVRNSNSWYTIIIDDDNKYWSGSTFNVSTPSESHIYGFGYCENILARYLVSSVDGEQDRKSGDAGVGRDDSALKTIKLGWDYDQRYADAKFGELFYYNVGLNAAQYVIASNYLAAKYQVDLGSGDYFAYDGEGYTEDLVGIGRYDAYDYHDDARGTGFLRLGASNMSDSSFILMAHDDAPMNWVPGSGPFQSERVERIWRADVYGEPGNVRVSLEKINVPSDGEMYALLVSDAADFDGNNAAYAFTETTDSLYTEAEVWKGAYVTIIKSSEEDIDLINENYSSLSITAYPSLTDGYFELYIRNNTALEGRLEIFNAIGQRIQSFSISGGKTVILPVATLGAGTYVARFVSEDYKPVSTRVIVVK